MSKIYISGKITGLPMWEVENRFRTAELLIRNNGHEAVNPLKVSPFIEGKKWEDYMIDCLTALKDCDGIMLLSDYKDSPGALIELAFAKRMGIEIIETFYSPKKNEDLVRCLKATETLNLGKARKVSMRVNKNGTFSRSNRR